MKSSNKTILILLLGLCLLVLAGKLPASDPDIKAYLIDEPIFNGQAYLVEAGDKNNPLIVMVHGLGDRAAETWRRVIPVLSKDFHVVTFDLPGFGRSSKANKLYSPDNYVRFINYVLARYQHKSFMLIGHSMGGNIALRYASIYPQKVNRLLLVDVAGILHRLAYVDFLRHFGIRILPEFYQEQKRDLESITDLLLEPLMDNSDLIELGEELILTQPLLREKILGGDPATIAAYAMIMTDYSRVLATLNVPTLILWGGRDSVTPIRTAKVLAGNLKHSGLIVFDETGHNPMNEEYGRFLRVLNRFVKLDKASLSGWLSEKKYKLDTRHAFNTDQVAECHNERGRTFRGDYKFIFIDNCQDIKLINVRAKSISIKDSEVSIENSNIRNTGKALFVKDSSVTVTSIEIRGKPSIDVIGSKIDMAGVRLDSGDYVLSNSGRIAGNGASARSKLLFSVSRISSKYLEKYLHGPVILNPGEGM